MSYQVLARKWRPHQFEQVSGQGHVVQMLTNALKNQRLHHAYLFSGTRGVGKTTLARIVAKCLNCENGISAIPCGQCHACQAIDSGQFVDLIEVDAASRTKVEETRELLDNVQYAPVNGRFKVYLIDEVHMLSNHSFNALLKTLEEPPAHVKFLLATTDPQKLPITVLSRCLQFNLTALAPSVIEKRLAEVLKQENIPFDAAALAPLAQAAKGSLRDALSLLDQAIAFGDGNIRQNDVALMLGTVEQHYLETLLNALAANDGATLMATIEQMAQQAADFKQALEALLSLLHRLAMAQVVPQALPDPATTTLDPQQFSKADIQLYYQIALIGKRDLPYAADAKSGFEMVMLRMLAFQPDHYRSRPQRQQATTIQPPPRTTATAPIAKTPPSAPPEPPTTHVEKGSNDKKDWTTMVAEIKLQGLSRALIKHTTLYTLNTETIILHLAPEHRSLLSPLQKDQIEQALKHYLGRTIKLTIEIVAPKQDTPAVQQQQQSEQRKSAAQQTIDSDATVTQLMTTFDATVEHVVPIEEEKS
ncbi:MAG: DNA polymerase III subunit gamma/tau [Gammaproteobacteria bacterium]|nr:DNA polymerase III subunit gamma/tau [Gammaproteobacteria bacterium]